MILLPKYKDIIVPVTMHKPVMKGHFIMEAVGLDGRVRKLAEFDNLITTNGGNLLGSSTIVMSACLVGSGNTPPALGNTSLQSFVAGTNTVNPGFPTRGASSSSPYFGITTTQYGFAIGAAAGNLSEVGVGPSTSNTNLFSRALILDGSGNPTTITVLSSEALYVTYQLQQYVPLSDVTGTVVIAGVTYNYTVRGSNATTSNDWAIVQAGGDLPGISVATAYNGAIGPITGTPSGSAGTATSISNNSYSSGSFTLSGTATWGLTDGNLSGGITAVGTNFGTSFNSRGAYQTGFSPAIPKDGSHVLTLTFSTSWAINTP